MWNTFPNLVRTRNCNKEFSHDFCPSLRLEFFYHGCMMTTSRPCRGEVKKILIAFNVSPEVITSKSRFYAWYTASMTVHLQTVSRILAFPFRSEVIDSNVKKAQQESSVEIHFVLYKQLLRSFLNSIQTSLIHVLQFRSNLVLSRMICESKNINLFFLLLLLLLFCITVKVKAHKREKCFILRCIQNPTRIMSVLFSKPTCFTGREGIQAVVYAIR